MDPITIAIISFILTFIAAKKGGLSTTGALLAATGVAGASYYVADKYQSKQDGPLLESDTTGEPPKTGTGSAIVEWVKNNPGLTGGLAAAGAGASLSTKNKKYLVWGAAAVGAFLILK